MSNRSFKMERFLHGKNHHKRRTNRNRPAPRSFGGRILAMIQGI